jgi:carboxymethylenebutenolidase
MTDVTIPTPTHQLRSYLARPVGEGPWPGVIVLHDAAGMSNDLRHQADWLAGAGYVAVAPDLFSWGRKMACLRATFRDVQAVGVRPSPTSRPPASGWPLSPTAAGGSG